MVRNIWIRTYYGTGFQQIGTINWDIMPGSPLKANRRFREIYRFHLKNAVCYYEIFLFFDPGNRGDMLLRNVSWLWSTTQSYIPEDCVLDTHRCETLKSYTVFPKVNLYVTEFLWQSGFEIFYQDKAYNFCSNQCLMWIDLVSVLWLYVLNLESEMEVVSKIR